MAGGGLGGGAGAADAGALGALSAANYDGVAASAAGAQAGMPQWQRGLMGLLTGDAKYGQNAPAIHGALGGLMGHTGQQPAGVAPRPQMRAPMGATPPISSFLQGGAGGLGPAPQASPMAMPFASPSPPMMAPQAPQSFAPWMQQNGPVR